MADLSTMSDDDLKRLYAGQPAAAAPTDVTQMSDDQLKAAYAQANPPSAAEDFITHTLPSAAYHTATGIATLPGNVDQLLSDIGNLVNRHLGLPEQPRLFGPEGGVGRHMPGKGGLLPTASDLEGQLQTDTGLKAPESVTDFGKAAEQPTEMALGALTMPAKSVLDVAGNLVKYAAVPEVAGKTLKTIAAARDASPETQALAEGVGELAGQGRAVLKDRPALTPATELPEVKAGVTAFYDAARAKGVVYKPAAYSAFVNDAGQAAYKMKINPTNFPGSAAVLNEIDKMQGSAVDFEELEQVRQQARAIADGDNENDARMARMLKKKIDGFVNGATPADVQAGNTTGMADLLKQGRDLRVKQDKMEIVQRAMRQAELSAVGQKGDMDTALSTAFRKVAMDEDFAKTFNPQEQAAIEEVVRKSRTERAGAFLEQFADPRRPRTFLIGAGVGAGAALGAGIPWQVGAMVPPAIGMAGRAIAQGITERQAAEAMRMIAGGSYRPPWRAAQRSFAPLSIPLANMATTPPGP